METPNTPTQPNASHVAIVSIPLAGYLTAQPASRAYTLLLSSPLVPHAPCSRFALPNIPMLHAVAATQSQAPPVRSSRCQPAVQPIPQVSIVQADYMACCHSLDSFVLVMQMGICRGRCSYSRYLCALVVTTEVSVARLQLWAASAQLLGDFSMQYAVWRLHLPMCRESTPCT